MTMLGLAARFNESVLRYIGVPSDKISETSGIDMNMAIVWIVLLALLTLGGLVWYYRIRQRSRNCRQFRTNRSSNHNPNLFAYGPVTTTYIVRPSGIAIAVATVNTSARYVAATAAAEAAEAHLLRQSRECIQLEGFDAPLNVGDDPCAICLSPLAEQQVSKASCTHLIHTNCYNLWLAKDAKRACPICRQPVDTFLSSPQSSCPVPDPA